LAATDYERGRDFNPYDKNSNDIGNLEEDGSADTIDIIPTGRWCVQVIANGFATYAGTIR
jgi:hypothetical protein